MPSGKVHVKIWKSLFPITVVIGVLIGIFWRVDVGFWTIIGGLLHGFGIDNDLDLTGMNRSEALWTQWVIFIPLVGWSTFYSRIFQNHGGHRSFWTHGFFISSAIRLLFFAFPFLEYFKNDIHRSLLPEFIGMFIGLSISDSWHTIADMITGEMNFGKKKIFFIPFKNYFRKKIQTMEEQNGSKKKKNKIMERK